MKLYVYHHCPYCIRAMMVANYKDISYETVFLLNDDEETCYRLVNAKQVPILEFDQGGAIAESLDIAARFDELGDGGRVIRPADDCSAFSAAFSDSGMPINCLLFPRNIALGLPEFMTEDARGYFRTKKEKIIGQSFSQAMTDTRQHKVQVETMLANLPAPSLPSHHENTISWDDVMIFPTLRNLTMVAELKIPPTIREYLNQVSQLTGIQLYLDQAI
ncbi:MAG: glutaredoxin 2 [Pseudomonadota bacterium]|nr:glutaredoxin 2 [Pseudomonadota bacterium]